jgi:hypothetical protein
MIWIVQDLLVCDVKGHGVGQRLTGTEVARIAWVRPAGDNHSQAVALAVTVSGGPEFNVYLARPVVYSAGTVGANAYISIADIRRSAIGGNVAEDQKEIGVLEAGAEKQIRGYRADDFKICRERFRSEQ